MIYYGLLVFFFLEYVRPSSYLPMLNALHLNSVIPVVTVIGSLVSSNQVQVGEILQGKSAKWIMLFLALIVISGLTCDVQMYALNIFQAVIGYFLIFILLRKEAYTIDRFKGVLKTLVAVHLVVAALNPSLFSGDGQRHYIESGGFLGDGNDFALSVNIAIPFCIFFLFESKSAFKKVFYVGLLAVLILSVVATQSRGGMLSLVAIGLYFWIKSSRKIFGIVAIASVVALIFAFAPAQFFERMETTFNTGEEMEGSAQGRVLAWGAAIRMAADHPLLGIGAGHFPVKYGVEYRPEGFRPNEIPWQTAHSSYFLVLGELGVPGLVCLLSLLISNFVAGERTLGNLQNRVGLIGSTGKNMMVALNASIAAFAVGGAFLSAAYAPHIFVLAALSECGQFLCSNAAHDRPV